MWWLNNCLKKAGTLKNPEDDSTNKTDHAGQCVLGIKVIIPIRSNRVYFSLV